MIRVHVVHHVSLFRSALVALLRAETTLDVSSAPGHTPFRGAYVVPPQVYVADIDCLNSPGYIDKTVSAYGDLGQGPGLLVLATVRKPGALRRAFDAGALGYVNKDGEPRRLVEAIHRVARGERFIDESLAFDFVQASKMPMTPRELSVLALAAEGAPIEEIARSLHLSKGTIRNYLAAAIRKVGGRNRLDAVRISQGAGWL
ncbi:response regulator transcription factor [Streptomyces sp. GMY02]|uniref:response regulator transcription factor n=1 Tax=Streptomyces sp. GMY02 TaxID=1333528 RepID=UPI001C2BBF2E|nr:response regulator transcription factor [Streptomyces sp. GMY02]QXE38346.1 response regulator transcription factor [Streptomyces sp. GMY02]